MKTSSKEPLLEPLLRSLRLRRVINYIPSKCKLLDIGCGSKASFLKAISPKINEGYGVDFKVHSQKRGNIQTQQIRLDEDLPFEDEFFDCITMLAVLEHIEKEQEILKEIHRVLKPNGNLIITVPSVWAKPVLEFLSFKLGIVSKAEILDHKRYYNAEILHNVIIESAGFTKIYHKYFQLWMNNFCVATK